MEQNKGNTITMERLARGLHEHSMTIIIYLYTSKRFDDFVAASGEDLSAQVVAAKKGRLKRLKNNFGSYIPDFRKVFLIIATLFLVERLYGISNPSKAIKYLMPFTATYFYEAGFTVLSNFKSKKRNKPEVEDDIEIKLGSQCTYSVALKCVRGTIGTVEMAVHIAYSECSLTYPACNVNVPCGHLCPARMYNIFPHYLINGTIWGGGCYRT